MLSSSLDTLLKLSKTKSPPTLFDYNCVTLRMYIALIGSPASEASRSPQRSPQTRRGGYNYRYIIGCPKITLFKFLYFLLEILKIELTPCFLKGLQ